MRQDLGEPDAKKEFWDKEGLAVDLFIFPNTGHWILTDLDKRVDVGLDYIRQGRSGN